MGVIEWAPDSVEPKMQSQCCKQHTLARAPLKQSEMREMLDSSQTARSRQCRMFLWLSSWPPDDVEYSGRGDVVYGRPLLASGWWYLEGLAEVKQHAPVNGVRDAL